MTARMEYLGETVCGRPLQLICPQNPASAVQDCNDHLQMRLIHRDFAQQLRRCIRNLLIFAGLYVPFAWYTRFQFLQLDGLCLGLALVLALRIFRLIKCETVTVTKFFGELQVTTTCTGDRQERTHLLDLNAIHDVVISEGYDKLRVIYQLNILSKGDLYKTRPIIPLLLSKPRIDILQIMYNQLQSVLKD